MKDLTCTVMTNRQLKGKMPAGGNWGEYYKQMQRLSTTARGLAINIWKGYSFAPVFEGRRKKDNFVSAWHAALDFDSGDETSSLDGLARNDFINYFCSFLYSTPSSTADCPKSRAVFVFDTPIRDGVEYDAIMKALAAHFPHSDQATKDRLRLFYGSEGCEVRGMWSVLPRAAALELVDAYGTSSEAETDGVQVVFTPRNFDEKEVADALGYIPPRGGYDEWLSILMAVHSAFPDSRGVRLCESWSPGYRGEVEKKFESFTGEGVTIKSLFGRAMKYGWKPSQKKRTGSAADRIARIKSR